MARQTFSEWKQAVDLEIQRRCGLSADDLPDYGYADAWDRGASVKATASAAIRAAVEY